MPNSVLTRQRSWIARIAVLAMIASFLVIGAVPAGAAVVDTSASCPSTIPSAGFTDIATYDATTQQAINCIAAYGISKGTSATTYGPGASVARWQMALFLTRQAAVHGVTLPSGASQGFTDIGGLDAATQTAINQLAQLGISKGTSATTFAPMDDVTREQMALFLTRLLGAVITLPASPASAGFTDISGLSAESQLAINQLAALGVAAGTSATTYSPASDVLRWQMALFLTRVLAADGILPAGAAAAVGAPQLVSVAFDAEDTVTSETRLLFTFDEDVAVGTAGNYWLADAFGNLYAAASAALSPSSDSVVRVIFDTDEYDNAVAAIVTGTGKGGASGAARDISGNYNVPGKVALSAQTVSMLDWPVDYPELQSVTEIDATGDDATFNFDRKIDVSASAAASFVLVLADGTTLAGNAINTTTDGTAVEVEYTGLTSTQAADVVRGFVAAGGAVGTNAVGNLNTVVDVTGASDSGVPDLVSVTVVDADASSKQVEFTFTTQLQTPIAAAGFELIYADGTTDISTAAAIKSGDSKTVQVTFGTSLDSDMVLYAHALPGAVTAFPSADANAVDGVKLGPFSFASGITAGPDLVTSAGSVAGLDGTRYNITLTFDEDVEASTLTAANLVIWDSDGASLTFTAGSLLDDDGDNTITIPITDAATVKALKDGDAPLISILGGAAAGAAEDAFGNTSYPTSVGCGC